MDMKEEEEYVWECRKKKDMYGYVGRRRRICMKIQEEEGYAWVCKKKKKDM